MARQKKSLAGLFKNEEVSEKSLIFIKLVETVRKSKNNDKIEEAFNKIVNMLEINIRNISYKFKIPGYDNNDVYQEALVA